MKSCALSYCKKINASGQFSYIVNYGINEKIEEKNLNFKDVVQPVRGLGVGGEMVSVEPKYFYRH
jgi:hypothetical protein